MKETRLFRDCQGFGVMDWKHRSEEKDTGTLRSRWAERESLQDSVGSYVVRVKYERVGKPYGFSMRVVPRGIR